ncbi:hypothetical protein P691DRAFT_416983 [Macrolepiota fuliginosa MF-IS2]|uniref:Nephrocystin 3-like N-terminal domain-containing protein n=1 Tax=Macrolepiota fuliginosa MF-IS2 TaxID=1400762 RepID=A0A9P5X4R7_9AGAR|nr:hypothetical protein P691DRAFT_416983 [Macrolepiota fuliginosa MF-IS2]
MPTFDLLPDSLADRLRRYIRPKDSPGQHIQAQLPQDVYHRSQGQGTEPHSSGLFNRARNFAINNSPMIENAGIVNINNSVFATGKPALEHLEPYTEPGAAMDSSARDPPPKCHPGTRLRISGKLEAWLDALEREWNMMWLHGPAGTGKSAVAQTFAEHCSERGRLGAAFFFSRSNDRNNLETVIPTLAYQLAVHCRSYNSALTN